VGAPRARSPALRPRPAEPCLRSARSPSRRSPRPPHPSCSAYGTSVLNTEEASVVWTDPEACLIASRIQTPSTLGPPSLLPRRPHAHSGVPAPRPPCVSGQALPAASSGRHSFLGRSGSLCLGRQQVTPSDSGRARTGAPCSALHGPLYLWRVPSAFWRLIRIPPVTCDAPYQTLARPPAVSPPAGGSGRPCHLTDVLPAGFAVEAAALPSAEHSCG